MRLTDFFFCGGNTDPLDTEEPPSPAEALIAAFAMLTGYDPAVADSVGECLADTKGYYASRGEILDRRGLQYSPEAEPWLCVIAAVEAALEEGFLREVKRNCSPIEFADAVKAALDGADVEFSLKNLRFDPQKSPAEWTELFNEYAGQSGVTLYYIDLYGDGLVMGAAWIADYAEAAEIAALAGIRITSRPS